MRHAIALLALAAAAPATDVEREVVARLLDRDVGAWARELDAEPLPRDPHELMGSLSRSPRGSAARSGSLP